MTRAQTPKTLDIYSIDVEGGKATLFVAPSGETMLTDAGIPDKFASALEAHGVKLITVDAE